MLGARCGRSCRLARATPYRAIYSEGGLPYNMRRKWVQHATRVQRPPRTGQPSLPAGTVVLATALAECSADTVSEYEPAHFQRPTLTEAG